MTITIACLLYGKYHLATVVVVILYSSNIHCLIFMTSLILYNL